MGSRCVQIEGHVASGAQAWGPGKLKLQEWALANLKASYFKSSQKYPIRQNWSVHHSLHLHIYQLESIVNNMYIKADNKGRHQAFIVF